MAHRMTIDTGWVTVPADGSGIAKPGPMDPDPTFTVRRIDNTVLVDLDGLRLTDQPGLCNIGRLPAWAAPWHRQTIHLGNDHPTSLHPSMFAVHTGRVLYWLGQWTNGALVVNRPGQLRAGLEWTTLTPAPEGEDLS